MRPGQTHQKWKITEFIHQLFIIIFSRFKMSIRKGKQIHLVNLLVRELWKIVCPENCWWTSKIQSQIILQYSNEFELYYSVLTCFRFPAIIRAAVADSKIDLIIYKCVSITWTWKIRNERQTIWWNKAIKQFSTWIIIILN